MVGDSTYIATNTTTQVVIGAGVLVRVIIGETAASTISIYDDTDGTSDTIAVLKASIAEGSYDFGVKFKTGCRVVTAGASKITVVVA